MGQRHQLFVIAKVGNYYRSLAAVHHQWLYGVSALRQCILLLQIFSTDTNWPMLQQELLLAERFFREKGPPPTDRQDVYSLTKRPTPFPFITTCLMIGAGHNASNSSATGVDVEPFGMGYDQGNNDDGITVLDITDLSQVRYCFVNIFERWHGPSSAGSDNEDENIIDTSHKPLTGRQYVESYYKPSELIYQRNVTMIETVDAKPLVDARALAETWPWGEWKLDPLPDTIPIPLDHNRTPRGTTSLVEQSLVKVVDAALSSDNFHFDLIDESIQNIPQFKERLRDCLIEKFADRVGVAPGSTPLLKLAYKDDEMVDWSPFSNLSVECLKATLASEELKKTTSLSISGTASMQSAHLVDALSSLDKIDSLYALDLPNRETDATSIQIYSDLATSSPRLIQNKLVLSGPFSHAIDQSKWLFSRTPPNPAFPVVQLLTYRNLSTGFMRHDPPQYESFFLGDVLLSPVRAVTGFFRYLESLNLNDGRFVSSSGTALQVANCFATASSSLETSQSVEIGPLPAETYKFGKAAYHSSSAMGCYSLVRDLDPGQWTVFLWINVPEGGKDNDSSSKASFKYAFVRSKIPISAVKTPEGYLPFKAEDLEAVDLKEFLRRTVPEVETDKLQDHTYSLVKRVHGHDISDEQVVNLSPSILQCMRADEAHDLLDKILDEMPKIKEIQQQIELWEQ